MRDERINVFVELAVAFIEGRADESQVAELNRALASDAALRDLFVDLAIQPGLLGEAMKPADTTPEPVIVDESNETIGRLRFAGPALAIAASVLATAAAVAIYVFAFGAGDSTVAPHNRPIATLIGSTGDVMVDDDLANPGSEYAAGSYSVESGTAEFMLRSNTSVTMTGRTAILAHDPMSVTLSHGLAEFHCPPDAVGFTVRLRDGVRIVDLGTRFAAHVDGDTGFVRTLEGRVRLESTTDRHELGRGDLRRIKNGVIESLDDVFTASDPATYLRFDLPDERTAVDLNGLRPAVVHGSAAVSETDSMAALVLDGRGYATIETDDVSNPIGAELTVAAWVRLESRDRQAIVHKCLSAPSYSLEVYEGKPAFVVTLSGMKKAIHVGADRETPVGRWVMLVGVYDGETVSLYLDGERVASMASPAPRRPVNPSSGPLFIGRRSDRDSDYVHGTIRRVAVFRSALSPEQIETLTQPESATFRESSPTDTEQRSPERSPE